MNLESLADRVKEVGNIKSVIEDNSLKIYFNPPIKTEFTEFPLGIINIKEEVPYLDITLYNKKIKIMRNEISKGTAKGRITFGNDSIYNKYSKIMGKLFTFFGYTNNNGRGENKIRLEVI